MAALAVGGLAAAGIPAALTAAVAPLGHGADHLKPLEVELLPLTAQVEGDEVAQVFEGDLALELELERHGPVAITAGFLADLHHQIAALRAGVDQLTPHREIPIALGQLVVDGAVPPSALGQGAGLPYAHHLQMEPLLFIAGAGIHHPEVGFRQIEVAPHQGEQPPQHNRLDLHAIGGVNGPTGELLGVRRHIGAPHHANGPVLQGLGDRGDGVLTHVANVSGASQRSRADWPPLRIGAPMPPAPDRPRLPLLTAAVVAAVLCVAGGWWLGQRQRPPERGRQAQPALQRQANDLLARLERGEASEAEQQRLLELLIALDRKAEATAILERLADQQPQRWSLRLLLAELRRDQNDRSGAEREVRQLLNLRPNQVEGLQLMALLQLETGRGSQARSQLQAAFDRSSKPQVKPEALPIGLLLANVLDRQKDPVQADAVLIRLAASFPGDQRPLLARALLQQERGDINGAQQSLAEARARKPGVADPRLDAVAAAWGLAPLRGPSPQQPPAKPAGSENP